MSGFGDSSSGEWIEARRGAFHLRRRLSQEEQLRVGDAVDCRTSEEAAIRFGAMKDFLPTHMYALVDEEIGNAGEEAMLRKIFSESNPDMGILEKDVGDGSLRSLKS